MKERKSRINWIVFYIFFSPVWSEECRAFQSEFIQNCVCES